MQQRSYTTQAIVLKHSDLGEADRIMTLFTPNKGKIRAVAKGIRRPISKKAGHLDLLTYSQLQFAQGRNLDIITQASTLEPFLHLRSELWHMTCGYYLTELIDRFIEDDTPHRDVFDLFLEALRTLDTDARALHQIAEGERRDADRSRTQLLLRYFEIYLLSCVGYEPVLRACAHCNTELKPEENGFTPSLGGALCPRCSSLWTQPISMNALKVLRLLQRTAWADVPRLKLDPRLHAEVEAAMYSLLRFHLERDLKSWSFLDTVRS
jgi:DNA repair protein RecO (recombination protein O)